MVPICSLNLWLGGLNLDVQGALQLFGHNNSLGTLQRLEMITSAISMEDTQKLTLHYECPDGSHPTSWDVQLRRRVIRS